MAEVNENELFELMADVIEWKSQLKEELEDTEEKYKALKNTICQLMLDKNELQKKIKTKHGKTMTLFIKEINYLTKKLSDTEIIEKFESCSETKDLIIKDYKKSDILNFKKSLTEKDLTELDDVEKEISGIIDECFILERKTEIGIRTTTTKE